MTKSEVTGGDLFADLAEAASDERFESLLKRPGVRIVRIVSNGQATPAANGTTSAVLAKKQSIKSQRG